jgi:NAD(P)-dependent dehydrogenase (short-subunit alcohol dehydrogenase family)
VSLSPDSPSLDKRPLAGRTALVTGAGHAAGRAYARALAAAGACVAVADEFADAGEQTARLIEKDGGTARFFPVDVTDEDSVRTVVDRCTGAFGNIGVLVNNPSRYRDSRFTALAEMTPAHWDRTMTVMVRGAMLMTKAAVPELAKSPGAAIVNHTSSAAYGVVRWLDYATARGAVIAMTRSLARELAPLGIRVNALSAGSSADEAMALGVVTDEAQMTATPDFRRQLIPRLCTDEDLAGPVVFLASSASAYMTGQTVEVDGGKFFLG